MNLKRFISFSLPLIVMLFTFAIYISISKIVTSYEKSINNDYSIVIVTSSPIMKDKVKYLPSVDFKEIIHLKREQILDDLKSDLSKGSFELLQKRLPYFYTLHLNQFPTSSVLKNIKKDLEKLSGIKSVETFSKDHDNIYSLLLLIKIIVSTLFISIIIFTFLIMINQVKIWFYEHKERLDIIKLHGGSIYYGAKPIIRIAILSSLFSSSLVVGMIYFIKENLNLFFTSEMLMILDKNLTLYTPIEIGGVFIISLLISFVTVFGILLKHRLK
ncbi:MAG: cell division protein FtsX [Arcobacteraceae bacterium]|nr:cell division protein FtsX [Arcobacteraceae bacterium]